MNDASKVRRRPVPPKSQPVVLRSPSSRIGSAEVGGILQVHIGIIPLHVIEHIEGLSVELQSSPFGKSELFRNSQIQVPTLLPAKNAAASATSIKSDQVGPEVVVNSNRVAEEVDALAPVRWVAVDADSLTSVHVEVHTVAVADVR